MLYHSYKKNPENFLVIVKVGGSLLTNKESSAKPKVLDSMVLDVGNHLFQLLQMKIPMILIHGAGSYGHPPVKKSRLDLGLKNPEQMLEVARIQGLQYELDQQISLSFAKQGIPCFPIQASATSILRNKILVHFDVQVISKLLERKFVPLLYGVPSYDEVMGISILSGDQIATYLAEKLKAKLLIHITSAGGVFTKDPFKFPGKAKLVPKIGEPNWEEVQKYLTKSSSVDVTGGMKKKVHSAYQLARIGIPTVITKYDHLPFALYGEKGTLIH